AADVTAFGHAIDGIRIDTNAPLSTLDGLTAYNNAQYGIYVDGPIGAISHGVAYGNRDGMYLTGAVGSLTDSTAYGNQQAGITLQNPGAAQILRNVSFGNRDGIVVSNPGQPQAVLEANLVHDNAVSGIAATYNVLVTGNTIFGHAGTSGVGLSLY